MKKVAIPIFQSRVSPVLDSCRHMLLIDMEQGNDMKRERVYLDEMSLAERCGLFAKLDVTIVICGGVSEVFANMLMGANIRLINGIAGEIDDVITAFLEERLDKPQFYMPGFRQDHQRELL
jgi:predicted Fe-Mo cluster-binding NifX family protein